MKKIICVALVLVMMLVMSVPAWAAETTGRTTTITTSIEATYTVTIPADTAITFNVLSNPIGDIAVTAARLEPGEKITVTASTDGKLKNDGDASKTIDYVLKSGGTAFTSAEFTAVGTKALTVDITQTAWNSAPAGDYTGTITFTVGYSGNVT